MQMELVKCIWAAELPGILNAALAGWKRIVERGYQFDFPQDIITGTQAWMRGANPVPEFIEACCTKSGKVLLPELYSAYQTFCSENGRHTNRGVMIHGISRKDRP
jgi:phage/plasmid-associated DNA primase